MGVVGDRTSNSEDNSTAMKNGHGSGGVAVLLGFAMCMWGRTRRRGSRSRNSRSAVEMKCLDQIPLQVTLT